MRDLIQPHVNSLSPYVPGKPIEETERELGIQVSAKLASNENCLGASPKAHEAVMKMASQVHLYPDASSFFLKQTISEFHDAHNIDENQIIIGNGTNEILTLLNRSLLSEGDSACFPWPSFIVYRLAARGHGCKTVEIPYDVSKGFDFDALSKTIANEPSIKLVTLANPNNPTGTSFGRQELEKFASILPKDTVLIIDEAYREYIEDEDYPDAIALMQSRPRTVVTRTFSKAYGLAGLRIGYALCDPEIAHGVNRLREPFNANVLGQVAARASLKDADHRARAYDYNQAMRRKYLEGFRERGFRVPQSAANFVMIKGWADSQRETLNAKAMYESLLRKGVITRPLGGYDLHDALRISVGTPHESNALWNAVDQFLKDEGDQ